MFSILIFLVSGWALYRFFWYLPSWLQYLSIGSVLIIAAYTLGFSLLESLVMLGLIVLFSVVFPRRIFRDWFVAQGSLLALASGVGAVLIQRRVSMIYDWEAWQVWVFCGSVLLMLLLLVLVNAFLLLRYPFLPAFVNAFAQRMTVFSIVYVPLGILGLVVVILRNIF